MRRSIYLSLLLVICFVHAGNAIDPPNEIVIGIPTWNFTIPITASRTTGVAPLSVFFSVGLPDSTSTDRPFHDYEYSWNFGDASSGVWGPTGALKNTDKGPVSAHVYEVPGIYTVALTVRSDSGVVVSKSFTIKVLDPDTFFSGTNTTCISDTASNDFTGCPEGSTKVSTDDISNLPGLTVSGKRILFRRGSFWSVANNLYPNYPSPSSTVHIGAYGTCQSPDSLGICYNAPQITVTGNIDGKGLINLHKAHDWRIMDLSFVGDKTVPGVAGANTDLRQLLVYKIKIRGFISTLGNGHWRTSDNDLITENTWASNDVRDTRDYLFYGGSAKLALLGNNFHNSDTTHVVRVWWAHLGVIAHNSISGSSLTNTNGRHALKLHGETESNIGTFAATGGSGLPAQTRFVVVSDNIIGSSGPWPVSIGPADGGQLCNIQDVIIEKNRFAAGFGQASPQLVQKGLMFEGRHMTARNNIVDGTGSANGYTGIYVARRGIEWAPLGNRVYNNTIYSNTKYSNSAVGVLVHADANDTEIINNLISFPLTSSKTAVTDQSGNSIISNNIISDSPGFKDAINSIPLFRDFSLTEESTVAIKKGIPLKAMEDFTGKQRVVPFDIGAYKY